MKRQKNRFKIALLAILMLTSVLITLDAIAQQTPKPTIVLVHGAFADGSSWNKVIPILQKNGYQAIAVQNPLSSLADDVSAVNRVLAEVKGKVILVGHSWGGMVITQAGNNEKVSALVYVAAYAPDEGQSIESISKDAYEVRKVPNVKGFLDPVVNEGYIQLKEETIINYFAQDLPKQEARVVWAVQGRLHYSAIAAAVTNPAWKNKPSHYAVSDNDNIISPILEAEMAKKIGATTYHLGASHVSMISQPQKIADIIMKAATAKTVKN